MWTLDIGDGCVVALGGQPSLAGIAWRVTCSGAALIAALPEAVERAACSTSVACTACPCLLGRWMWWCVSSWLRGLKSPSHRRPCAAIMYGPCATAWSQSWNVVTSVLTAPCCPCAPGARTEAQQCQLVQPQACPTSISSLSMQHLPVLPACRPFHVRNSEQTLVW